MKISWTDTELRREGAIVETVGEVRRRDTSPPLPVPLYFDLAPGQREPTEHEVRLALDIQFGQRLMIAQFLRTPSNQPLPQVDTAFDVAFKTMGDLEEPEAYYELIAAVLQAAELSGWDAHDLCEKAIGLQQAMKRDALKQVVQPGRPDAGPGRTR